LNEKIIKRKYVIYIMEPQYKSTQKRKKDTRIHTVYSRCLITRKIVLPINTIGKNLKETIEENIKSVYEGRCLVEGYVKPTRAK